MRQIEGRRERERGRWGKEGVKVRQIEGRREREVREGGSKSETDRRKERKGEREVREGGSKSETDRRKEREEREICERYLQLMLVLRATEQEIQQRTKAAESGWSALTVADLQTTSEGTYHSTLCSVLMLLINCVSVVLICTLLVYMYAA